MHHRETLNGGIGISNF